MTGKVEERRARESQSLKYLDIFSTCWKDNISPTQLIWASEDRELWHHMVANVIYDGMTPKERSSITNVFPCCRCVAAEHMR